MQIKDLDDIIEKWLIQVFKDLDKGYDAVLKDFYDLMADVMAWTMKYLSSKYPKVSKKGINLAKLLYDNLTDDRIKKYADKFLEDKDKTRYFYEISRICDSESYTVMNKLMYEKMKDIADYAIVHGGDGCGSCPVGTYRVDELRLPPYHPECKCWVEYVVADDEEIREVETEVGEALIR